MSEPNEPAGDFYDGDRSPDDYRDGEAEEVDKAPSEDLTIDETIQNIDQLSQKVKEYQAAAVQASDRGDPENLSKTLLRLARVNSALGKNAAYAMYLARNADRAARRFRADKTLEYVGTKMAVNRAELKAELDSKDKFSNASECQLIADQASDMCFRTDTFLKMAQSRLSLIKGDIKNG